MGWTANCLQGVKYGLDGRVVAGLRSSSSETTPLVLSASGVWMELCLLIHAGSHTLLAWCLVISRATFVSFRKLELISTF